MEIQMELPKLSLMKKFWKPSLGCCVFFVHPEQCHAASQNNFRLLPVRPGERKVFASLLFSLFPFHLILFIRYITIVWKFSINQCLWLFNLGDMVKNLHGNVSNCLCVWASEWEILIPTLEHDSSHKTNYEWKWLLIYFFLANINYSEWILAWFSFICPVMKHHKS